MISWHLGKKLNDLGYLDCVIIFSKGGQTSDFSCKEPIPYTKLYLFIKKLFTRTVGKLCNIPDYIFRGIDERLFDFFCNGRVSNNANIVLATHPVIPGTLEKLKGKGKISVLIALNPFDKFIEKLVFEEMKRYSINSTDAYTSGFRQRELERCIAGFDYIISPSSVISETYSEYGYGDKIIDINCPLGADFEMFANKAERKDNVFRVCYIARSVLLKGLQYLLEAWRGFDIENSELLIGSSIDRNVKEIINNKYKELGNVKYAGVVKDVNAFYRQSTIFVCPSLIDGGPKTVFEAMACGLPVIITEGCGAKDIIDNGNEGFIVPIRDHQAIREKILWFKDHPKETIQMGLNARTKIENYNIGKFAANLAEALDKL